MLKQRDDLITITDPKSPVSEAYRTLRTNIQFSSLDKPLRTLLLTSTGPDEGKSTTLANLGITFAQAGNRVILVDCDLRRPSLHEIFGLDNATGLTNLFIEETAGNLPLQSTSVANLRVLTAGQLPPNPSELLGSRRLEKIIEILKTEADFVLFDSPPIIAVTDAAVLARKVDGVLLVISAGKTKRDRAVKARLVLEKVNANILGVVLNNVKLDRTLYGY
ncbi:MAG: CpsD/CapB family tyrosine-protein kinase [Dehalococcoidales bacterium]|nr:CpsD/CapB family tyrosine-protein kinase [Dehalococcoidales bacterium]